MGATEECPHRTARLEAASNRALETFSAAFTHALEGLDNGVVTKTSGAASGPGSVATRTGRQLPAWTIPAALAAAGLVCFMAAMILMKVSDGTQPWLRIGIAALAFSAEVWGWYSTLRWLARRRRQNITG
ncbi:hypothetical protein ABT158_41330 [Nonomuraea sp. NPDC001636]|uniref:hypothetical protein n=1 Tax=Nonomuraea sp. NPDC001636 TaxID=3154391 RepID=UPI00332FD8EC